MKTKILEDNNLVIIPETEFEKDLLTKFRGGICYPLVNDDGFVGLKIKKKTFEDSLSNNDEKKYEVNK